ncbi:MAG TPA: ABC transporter ATP-binding protein, partial [Chloroflexia bacterium]|nr:ABC transporter ATP-binding protein [Chloroflexia bacterium]
MTTARLAWGLVAVRPGIFLANLGLWSLFAGLPLAYGLVLRAFFDALTGQAPAGPNVWTLITLLLVAEAGRMTAFYASFYAFATFWFGGQAVLRKNMLARILDGPGRQALPDSAGEAVSRFRDDVEEVMN